MNLQSFLASSDTNAIVLVAVACTIGFLMLTPSEMTVRTVCVVLATYGMCSWIVNSHSNTADNEASNDQESISLFNKAASGRPSKQGQIQGQASTKKKKKNRPYATLMYAEATSAIAALALLSQPGHRGAVHSVTRATEDVIKAYHTLLIRGNDQQHTSACIDDMRSKVIVALDALQGVRMETGSRGEASTIVSKAEKRLRALFAKFREIASNRLNIPELLCSPLAFDPFDDPHFIR